MRANNAVSHFLPSNLGGFSGQLMVAPSEELAGQRYLGARFGYATGDLKLSGAFGQTDTANADTPKLKSTSIGGSYNFGVATLEGFANHNTYDGAANYVISGGPAIGSLTRFSNTGCEFGLRHFF